MRVARKRSSRLFGMALRRKPCEPLLIPRCRSVHTFGMRFALDLVWLAADGRVVRVDRAVPPFRVRTCRRAAAVIEAPHGMICAMEASKEPVSEGGQQQTSPDEARSKMRSGLDPRQRIQRDSFNEYFVFALSATGAALLAPVLLYVVMAITGIWNVGIFIVAAVLVELILIFGIGRPAMKRHEAGGWALLWGFATAVMALCFYYLIADPTIG